MICLGVLLKLLGLLKLTLVVVLCDMIGCSVETVGFVKAHTCSCFCVTCLGVLLKLLGLL